MTNSTATLNRGRVTREATLRWVPLSEMRVSPVAQRDLNHNKLNEILTDLDLEQLGALTVSERDGAYYIIDGQHRHAALKAFFEDDDVKVQCWTYTGLTEEDEAERFLRFNNTLTVTAFAKFRIGVVAGRADESDIDRIVRANGCIVSQDKVPGAIGAVGTLCKLYERTGPQNLGRTIRNVHGAYGDLGLEAIVLEGIGLMLDRYNGSVDDVHLVGTLGKAPLGARGLIQQAEQLRLMTGNSKAHCLAAAAVDAYNKPLGPRSGKRLPSWWKDAS